MSDMRYEGRARGSGQPCWAQYRTCSHLLEQFSRGFVGAVYYFYILVVFNYKRSFSSAETLASKEPVCSSPDTSSSNEATRCRSETF